MQRATTEHIVVTVQVAVTPYTTCFYSSDRMADAPIPPKATRVVPANSMSPKEGVYILFVHGAGRDIFYWERIQELAAERGYASVALSLAHDNWHRKLGYYCRQIAHVVDAAHLPGRPILWGHSLGSLISSCYLASSNRPWGDANQPADKRAIGQILYSPAVYLPVKLAWAQLSEVLAAQKKLKKTHGHAYPAVLTGNTVNADVLRARNFKPDCQTTTLIKGSEEGGGGTLDAYCKKMAESYGDAPGFSDKLWLSVMTGTKYGKARNITVPMLVVAGSSTGVLVDDDLVCSEKTAASIVAFHDRPDCTRLPPVASQCHDLGDAGWEEEVFAPCIAKCDEWAAAPAEVVVAINK